MMLAGAVLTCDRYDCEACRRRDLLEKQTATDKTMFFSTNCTRSLHSKNSIEAGGKDAR